jgi:cell division ATPase FtsA
MVHPQLGQVGTYFVRDPIHMVGNTVNVTVHYISCRVDVDTNMQRAFIRVRGEGGGITMAQAWEAAVRTFRFYGMKEDAAVIAADACTSKAN